MRRNEDSRRWLHIPADDETRAHGSTLTEEFAGEGSWRNRRHVPDSRRTHGRTVRPAPQSTRAPAPSQCPCRTAPCGCRTTAIRGPLRSTQLRESREPRAESREPRAESREPRAESREPRAESREPRAESREPRAESREPRAESREPRAESREPRAESREPRAESREPRAESRNYTNSRGTPCLG